MSFVLETSAICVCITIVFSVGCEVCLVSSHFQIAATNILNLVY